MSSHKEVLRYLSTNKEVLADALGLPSIWVRSEEYVIDRKTKEKADLVFQDKFDPYQGLKDATCFALELKKEKGDHEVLGQLKKYTNVLNKLSRYGHWGKVEGIAVAQEYTKSGKELLWDEGFRTFIYYPASSGGFKLREEKKIIRKASKNSNR
jgi:RecB family endonuclease NucS